MPMRYPEQVRWPCSGAAQTSISASAGMGTRGGKGDRMTTAATTHTTQLLTREEIAEGTMAFHFSKPVDFDGNGKVAS